MPAAKYKNNAWATLASGITDADTSIPLTSGHGARFPSLSAGEYFYATLINSSLELEIVKVTARSTDTLTVVRAQDNTTARAYSAGDRLELRWCSAYIDALFGGGVPTRTVDTISSNTTLTSADAGKSKVITATATATLPAAADLEVGQSIEFKSTTTGKVLIAPQGGDTIDGIAGNYRLPSYCKATVTKSGSGAFTLLERPDVDVGDVKPWPTNTAPTGWALCGGNYSRTTYAGLFDVIGTTFGAGDGSTTFGVPDIRGRTIAGKDDMGGSAASRLTSSTSGVAGNTLAAAGGDERAHAHSHTFSGTTSGQSADHTHAYTAPQSDFRQAGGDGASREPAGTNTGGSSNDHTHTYSGTTSTALSGGSQNVQPTIVLNYIIKT